MEKKKIEFTLIIPTRQEAGAFVGHALVPVKIVYEALRLHGSLLCFFLLLYMFSTIKKENEGSTEVRCSSDPPKIQATIEVKEAAVPAVLVSNETSIKETNECAPVSASQVKGTDVNDYIKRFSKVAITEMEMYGVPASISLAQGLIESRAGKSKLALQANNHFGIKCFSKRCKKGHCMNATDDTHKDFFRKFESPWFSWREHSRMISSGRYAKLKKHGRDYRKWAYGLKAVGYATDRNYAEKLIGIIEKYQLYKYDGA